MFELVYDIDDALATMMMLTMIMSGGKLAGCCNHR